MSFISPPLHLFDLRSPLFLGGSRFARLRSPNGLRSPAARCAKLALRGRFAALRCARLRLIPPATLAGPVLLVADPQPLEREERLDGLDRVGRVWDLLGEATRPNMARWSESLVELRCTPF